jgi:hypothetical protein
MAPPAGPPDGSRPVGQKAGMAESIDPFRDFDSSLEVIWLVVMMYVR